MSNVFLKISELPLSTLDAAISVKMHLRCTPAICDMPASYTYL